METHMADQASEAVQANPLLELKAMEEVHRILEPLPQEGRNRVITWAISAMQLTPGSARSPGAAAPQTRQTRGEASSGAQSAGASDGTTDAFATFAELFSAASPSTNAEKALVGGYWLQECEGEENFTSMSVNNELKNLGEGVENITSAFDALKDGRPQLALQLRKEGKSQQARKKYKLTVAGIRGVRRMIGGERLDG
jgi:hypothetical protein